MRTRLGAAVRASGGRYDCGSAPRGRPFGGNRSQYEVRSRQRLVGGAEINQELWTDAAGCVAGEHVMSTSAVEVVGDLSDRCDAGASVPGVRMVDEGEGIVAAAL